jgi:hypothetical protein
VKLFVKENDSSGANGLDCGTIADRMFVLGRLEPCFQRS